MNVPSSSRPFFTVIIPSYNAEATIAKCLESVLSQSETTQIILVDGLSKDRTIALATPLAERGIQIICEKDKGVFDAWNKGLSEALGEWIIFIGADDYYPSSNCLALLHKQLLSAPECVEVAYGRVKLVNQQGEVIAEENEPWNKVRLRLNTKMPFTHVGTAHKRSMFAARRFDENFRIAGDYHFLFPSLSKVEPLFVKDYVVCMGDGGLSTNARTRVRLIEEIKTVHRAYKVPTTYKQILWLCFKQAFFGIKNYLKY